MIKRKEILLVRHAKSSWAEPGLSDFDRPLNQRGMDDIARLKEGYKHLSDGTACIISSSAKRTSQTAEGIAPYFGIPIKNIRFVDELYLAEIPDFLTVITSLTQEIDKVIVVSHNYGISDFAHYLLGDDAIGTLPTFAAVRIDCQCTAWKMVSAGNASLKEYLYPKAIL